MIQIWWIFFFDQPSEQCNEELEDSHSQDSKDDGKIEDSESYLEEIWESSDSESVGSDLETGNTNSLAHNVLMGVSLSLHFSCFVFQKEQCHSCSCFSEH